MAGLCKLIMQMRKGSSQRGPTLAKMMSYSSISPWASAIVLKKDGGLRFCVDYCVNNATEKDTYSLPRMLNNLADSRWFSTQEILLAPRGS